MSTQQPYGVDTTQDRNTIPNQTVAITNLADTDYVDIPIRVPSGKTLKIWSWGARTASQTTPTGLSVGLYDFGAAAYTLSANATYSEGEPIVSQSGAADLALRLENTTGGTVDAGAIYAISIE